MGIRKQMNERNNMIRDVTEYPATPGWKTDSPPTSKAAGLEVEDRAATLRQMVAERLAEGPATADEVAEAIGATVLATRPRLSELRAQGKIEPTGDRRRNESGHSASVWKIVLHRTQQEFAL